MRGSYSRAARRVRRTAYCLGDAVRRHCEGTRSRCAAKAPTSCSLDTGCTSGPSVLAHAIDALASVPAESVEASPLLGIVAGWPSVPPQRLHCELNSMLRTHQLVNRHLIPFDHGMMAHSIECRVPFLDREVAQFISAVPEPARTAGNTSKVLLRLVVSDLLRASGTGITRLVLDRRPSPFPAAIHEARIGLVRRITGILSTCDRERSRLDGSPPDSKIILARRGRDDLPASSGPRRRHGTGQAGGEILDAVSR